MLGLTSIGCVVQSPVRPDTLNIRKTLAFPLVSVENGFVPVTSVKNPPGSLIVKLLLAV